MESFRNLGGKPTVIYADQEPSWSGRYVQQFLKDEDIFSASTLTQAGILGKGYKNNKKICYISVLNMPQKYHGMANGYDKWYLFIIRVERVADYTWRLTMQQNQNMKTQ